MEKRPCHPLGIRPPLEARRTTIYSSWSSDVSMEVLACYGMMRRSISLMRKSTKQRTCAKGVLYAVSGLLVADRIRGIEQPSVGCAIGADERGHQCENGSDDKRGALPRCRCARVLGCDHHSRRSSLLRQQACDCRFFGPADAGYSAKSDRQTLRQGRLACAIQFGEAGA